MALRFQSKQNIAIAGTTIPHGLGLTPDEVWTMPSTAAGFPSYIFSAQDATNVYLATGTAAHSAWVYAAYNHSIIR